MNIPMHHQDGGAALLELPHPARAARAGLSMRCGCLMCCGSCRSAGTGQGGACRGTRATPSNLRGLSSSRGLHRANGRYAGLQARAWRRVGGGLLPVVDRFSDLRSGAFYALAKADGAQFCATPRYLPGVRLWLRVPVWARGRFFRGVV